MGNFDDGDSLSLKSDLTKPLENRLKQMDLNPIKNIPTTGVLLILVTPRVGWIHVTDCGYQQAMDH